MNVLLEIQEQSVYWFHCGDNKEESTIIVKRLFLSPNIESSEVGAQMAANLYIIHDSYTEDFYTMIFHSKLSETQIKGINRVTIELMKVLQYHERATLVIEELIRNPVKSKGSMNALFYRDSFVLPQDVGLIKKIVTLNPNIYLTGFCYYIEKADASLLDFAEMILHICNQYACNKENVDEFIRNGYYAVSQQLPNLVSALYDQSSDDTDLHNKCLDMWDTLYKRDMGNIKAITQQIMDR